MRAFLPLLALLLLPAAAVPDTAATTLAPDSEARWVGFTLTPANQIAFEAVIDGKPVRAMLDTGASVSVLSRAFADRTGRKVAKRGTFAAIGGALPAGWTALGTLSFGGLTRIGGGIHVVALPGAVTGGAEGFDLLVGRDLLAAYALEIDYAGARFRLLRSGRMPFAGVRLPLAISAPPASYVTEITIAGRRLRPIIVDTGDGTGLTLARGTWRTLLLATQPPLTTQLAHGAGGAVVAEIGTLPAVGLGAASARDVPVWVEPTGGFSDTTRRAGRIGGALLQRYRVLLDPAAGQLVLGDAPPGPPPPRATVGLQLGLAGGELRVLHVMRGSPAAAGGWQIGDRICAIDGTTVASDPAAAARAQWPFAPPGTVIRLTLCDGTGRALTAARFY